MERYQFIFAGGGSGGHLYPGLAVAEALETLESRAQILFLVTQRAIDEKIMSARKWEFLAQPIEPIPNKVIKLWDFCQRWRNSTSLCRKLLREREAVGVLGLGGFASGPMLRMAARADVPIGMLNPDMVPGKANRFSQKYADKIFLQWDESREFFGKNARRCITSGCPIRLSFAKEGVDESQQKAVFEDLGLETGRPFLLVMAGSQGGRNVNEAFFEGLRADGTLRNLLSTWQICHLSGVDDEKRLREGYQKYRDLKIVVRAFTDKMEILLRQASLVLGRAGASSLAELTAVGVGSILMPYPYHKDDHQMKNAQVLAQAGAALIVRDERDTAKTMPALRQTLCKCLTDKTLLKNMSQAAKKLGKPDAAIRVAQELLAMRKK